MVLLRYVPNQTFRYSSYHCMEITKVKYSHTISNSTFNYFQMVEFLNQSSNSLLSQITDRVLLLLEIWPKLIKMVCLLVQRTFHYQRIISLFLGIKHIFNWLSWSLITYCQIQGSWPKHSISFLLSIPLTLSDVDR